MVAKKGQHVQIHNIVLKPEERAPQVPEDTKKVPLEMWVKGTILSDCEIGNECEIETSTGRIVKGVLAEIEPPYTHDFGNYVEELNIVGRQVKKELWGAQ